MSNLISLLKTDEKINKAYLYIEEKAISNKSYHYYLRLEEGISELIDLKKCCCLMNELTGFVQDFYKVDFGRILIEFTSEDFYGDQLFFLATVKVAVTRKIIQCKRLLKIK